MNFFFPLGKNKIKAWKRDGEKDTEVKRREFEGMA